MSVRRLADAAVQPASFAFNRGNAAWAKQTIRKYPKGREQSAVIPLLMRAQEQEGWVTRAAIEHVSEMLDMPLIRVLEVATFYTQYQLGPVGTRAHVQVCGTTPCMLRGSEALMDVCRSKIHPEQFHTNEAGTLSWEEVECQGACVNAPMVMIFKDTYEDLTPERLEEIIDAFEKGKGKSIDPGPQNGRIYSAPISGLTSLTDEKAVSKAARAREAKASAAGSAAKGDQVPPSKAAKPKTDTVETSPAIKSPSRKKASANGEKAASVSAPRENKAAAETATVGGEPRHHARPASRANPGKKSPDAAPEPKKARSATVALAETAKAVERPKSVRAKPAVGKVNPTMALARTAKGEAKPAAPSDANRPSGMKKPAKPDDLKMISGVGPKIEKTLNELGIYTFAQVAAWKKAEREWVDGYLRFHGRIERDDWVKQAKALAKGGRDEYVKVFGKEPR